MPAGKKNRAASTTLAVDDFSSNDTYELEDDLEIAPESERSSGFAAWKWIVDHWEVPASMLSLAAVILIFATKLDSKVEVLTGDVKDVKGAVEKLSTESTRTSTEVGQLQKAVNRLEEQRQRK
jgi:HAMP domain-containing protein